jgi:hypothetical protein
LTVASPPGPNRTAPVVVAHRFIGSEFDDLHEVGKSEGGIALLVALQVGVAPVEPGRSQLRIKVYGGLQVVEGQVQAASLEELASGG